LGVFEGEIEGKIAEEPKGVEERHEERAEREKGQGAEPTERETKYDKFESQL
jgi:hypothetical protein